MKTEIEIEVAHTVLSLMLEHMFKEKETGDAETVRLSLVAARNFLCWVLEHKSGGAASIQELLCKFAGDLVAQGVVVEVGGMFIIVDSAMPVEKQ